MSIDKFGRTLKGDQKDLKGPKGDGFNLTPEGHFDIDKKRLTNLGDPVASRDAATKVYVDIRSIPTGKDGYMFLGKRLRDVSDPIEDSDAVNLHTVKKLCLHTENSDYNANNNKIINLNNPVNSQDAATKAFVQKELVLVTTNLVNQQLNLNEMKDRLAKCEGKIENNKIYHDKNLKKFGVLLFNYINQKQSGRTVSLPTAGEDDYLNWEELFAVGKGQPASVLESEVMNANDNDDDLGRNKRV